MLVPASQSFHWPPWVAQPLLSPISGSSSWLCPEPEPTWLPSLPEPMTRQSENIPGGNSCMRTPPAPHCPQGGAPDSGTLSPPGQAGPGLALHPPGASPAPARCHTHSRWPGVRCPGFPCWESLYHPPGQQGAKVRSCAEQPACGQLSPPCWNSTLDCVAAPGGETPANLFRKSLSGAVSVHGISHSRCVWVLLP